MRDASHAAFVEHKITVQLLHPHPRSNGVDNGTALCQLKGSATESKKQGGMSLVEVSNDSLEWESPDAHRVHVLSELLSQLMRNKQRNIVSKRQCTWLTTKLLTGHIKGKTRSFNEEN